MKLNSLKLFFLFILTQLIYIYSSDFSPIATTKQLLTHSIYNTGTLVTFSDGSMATAFTSGNYPFAAFFDHKILAM